MTTSLAEPPDMAGGGMHASLFAPLLQAMHFTDWLRRELRREGEPGLLGAVLVDLLAGALFWIPIGAWLAARGRLLQGLVFGFALPYAIGLCLVYLSSFPLHTLTVGERLDDLPRSRATSSSPQLRHPLAGACVAL
jgi:hypothetical protein